MDFEGKKWTLNLQIPHFGVLALKYSSYYGRHLWTFPFRVIVNAFFGGWLKFLGGIWKKRSKNLTWIKFSKANGARWLMAVRRHDSIVGKKIRWKFNFWRKIRWKFARRQTKEVVGTHKATRQWQFYRGHENKLNPFGDILKCDQGSVLKWIVLLQCPKGRFCADGNGVLVSFV